MLVGEGSGCNVRNVVRLAHVPVPVDRARSRSRRRTGDTSTGNKTSMPTNKKDTGDTATAAREEIKRRSGGVAAKPQVKRQKSILQLGMDGASKGILVVSKLKARVAQRLSVFTPQKVAPKRTKEEIKADAQAARKAFMDADVNKDGVLSFKELKEALRVLATALGNKARLTAEEISAAFDAADSDNNDVVNVEEFVQFYHGWAAEQRLQAAKPMVKRKSRLTTPKSSVAEDFMAKQHEKVLALEASKASLARARALLKSVTTLVNGDPHVRELNDKFVEASSGEEDGIHSFGSGYAAKGIEEKIAMENVGRVDKIELDLDSFSVMCVGLGIDGVPLQDSFFRMCRPGSDGKLTFQELLRGIAPILKGSLEQRAAFHFLLYDEQQNGTVDSMEIFRLMQTCKPDSAIERDLVNFAKLAKDNKQKDLDFSKYLEHIALHGECRFHEELKTRLSG